MAQTSKKVRPSFFHRLFARKNSSAKSPPPPPYTNDPAQRQIKAASAPQWLWSKNQCQEWITSVLVEYGSLPESEALDKAKGFKGFGPCLFSTSPDEWLQILGREMGSSVYSLIWERKHREGALPGGVTFMHFVTAKQWEKIKPAT